MKLCGIHRYAVKSMRGEAVARASVERQGLADDRRYMVVDTQGRFVTARELPALLQVEARVSTTGLTLSHAAHPAIDVALPPADARRSMVAVWGDEVPARIADDATNLWLSDVLGRTVRLVYLADSTARGIDRSYSAADDVVSFADGFPVLLVTEASLEDLNARLAERRMDHGAGMEMARFRPNVVVSGSVSWDEDEWRIVRIGQVRFKVVKPCARCVLTTRDPQTGAQVGDNEPLRTLGTFHRGKGGGIMFGQNMIPLETGEISVGDGVEVIERGSSNLG